MQRDLGLLPDTLSVCEIPVGPESPPYDPCKR